MQKKQQSGGFSQYFKNKYFILDKDYKLNFSYLKKLEKKLKNKRVIFLDSQILFGKILLKY